MIESQQEKLYRYRGKIFHVADGDTCVATVDLGFKVSKEVILRLAKINAPEMKSGKPGTDAKAALESKILNQVVFFDSKTLDKYGRSIAEIFLTGETVSVNTWMVEQGYAKAVRY